MTSRLPQSVVALVAAAFLGYWSLLLYSEVFRPAATGMSLAFSGGAVDVTNVSAGGPADNAGLRPGDRLVAIDGHRIRGRLDMLAVIANVDIGRPQRFTIERDSRNASIDITPAKATRAEWRAQSGPTILIVRVVQLTTLLLATVVALKRPRDATALVGAAFLATVGVFSVTMPPRLAVLWRALPFAAGLPLWLPFMSSTLIGLWLYAFFAVFPHRRFRSPKAWLLLGLPIVPGMGSHALWAYHVIVVGDSGPNLRYWPVLLVVVNGAAASVQSA